MEKFQFVKAGSLSRRWSRHIAGLTPAAAARAGGQRCPGDRRPRGRRALLWKRQHYRQPTSRRSRSAALLQSSDLGRTSWCSTKPIITGRDSYLTIYYFEWKIEYLSMSLPRYRWTQTPKQVIQTRHFVIYIFYVMCVSCKQPFSPGTENPIIII